MGDEKSTFKIRFENSSVSEAGRKAAELRDSLLDINSDISAEIVKDDPTTQDFGSTLVLVLGAPAVVIIARGIANYLKRAHGSIVIETDDGTVVATGITGQDAARIAEAFAPQG